MSIAFLPLLARGCDVIPGYSSSVVNVTSNSAFLKNTTRGHISYGASKAGRCWKPRQMKMRRDSQADVCPAFVHLSRMLAHLFSQTEVRVNMIAPGTFPTEVGHTFPSLLDNDNPSRNVRLHSLSDDRRWLGPRPEVEIDEGCHQRRGSGRARD